ncbi:NAD(P)-dependent oxidoreductase [Miniphocaeibacter halophilus]|uniref:Hydroxyacid dehydrogenase n=1 Tax=Miniphocaeibacter halophilus TaxID=2931922 RepID=A0AC61MTW4_9FIRM|nr:NAD(P)-dependent oxidoreductase [Miniphocaeibacter halophilus]QQK08279.1 hydroxyacid dehydrogenase [Miniphocaeibacter halophilus]
MKITILEPLSVEDSKLKQMAKYITNEGHELEIYNTIAKDDEEAKERVKDTDILIIANSLLSGEVIRTAKNLKMISVAFTGYDHVDLEACRERNILVSNAAGYSTTSVAELAYGLIIGLYRNILPMDKATRDGRTKAGYRYRDLYKKTIGVVGTGAIGKHVANIALAFGCKVVAYDKDENNSLKFSGVKYLDLEELLKVSDIVTVHLPLLESTRKLFGRKEFELMKDDAIFINTARGPIVDNDALADALNENIIGGAGIDVFDIEPPLKGEEKLLKAKNTIVTPHIAFFTEEAMVRRAEITFDNVYSWINKKPKNIVSS